MKPTIREMEDVLRNAFPDEESFPLLRTLPMAAAELGIPTRFLIRSLKDPGRTLWKRGDKVYVPPDVFERWRKKQQF